MSEIKQTPFLFERLEPSPLDIDYKVETLTDLETLKSKKTTYEGMLTYCVEDSTLYIFNAIGEFEPVGGTTTAENVTYQNDDYADLTNVKSVLDKLIEDVYYVNPEITSFTASTDGGIFEVGTTITAPVAFDWTYNKNISTQSLTDCTLTDNTDRTSTYNSDITSDKTFTLTASDGKENVTKSISYTFVNPYYIGVSYMNTLTEADITTLLTKKVEVKGSKTVTYDVSQSYMVFTYPIRYGAISSIIDQNGFNVTDSFTQNILTVNSVAYYVYVSNKCSGTYTMKFNY